MFSRNKKEWRANCCGYEEKLSKSTSKEPHDPPVSSESKDFKPTLWFKTMMSNEDICRKPINECARCGREIHIESDFNFEAGYSFDLRCPSCNTLLTGTVGTQIVFCYEIKYDPDRKDDIKPYRVNF